MFRTLFFWMVVFCLIETSHAQSDKSDVVIVVDKDASWIERLAAQEVRRYVFVRTGLLPQVRDSEDQSMAKSVVVVGNKERAAIVNQAAEEELRDTIEKLEPEQYVVKTRSDGDRKVLLLVGGDGVGTLYAAYRFAEQLGIRFYLHGDVIPDERVPLQLGEYNEVGKPLFHRRGIQPFHDFPEGPDWWDAEAYKAVLGQLPKMRMNFFGLHTYPQGGVGPEPTVWIGPPEELGDDGKVLASYPSRHFVSSNVTSAWGYRPKKTSDYAFGAAEIFDRDDYGADYMRDTFPWNEMDQEKANGLFDRFGEVLKESFEVARKLGIKTCVGTETPLILPKLVRERLAAAGRAPRDAATVQHVYEGMFRRIMAAYAIDYYWLWTPEDWTWREVKQDQIDATLADFQAIQRAADAVSAPFQLATCGWVLGPPQEPALFDSVLPKSWPLSCINRNVGHDPVEPGFAAVDGRPQWAIPWLEDDPAMIIPQLWVGRMRKDAADALRYGCDGLLGIHWRTRILGPNVSALAHAAWSQEGWKSAEVDREPPKLEGTFDDRRLRYPVWRLVPSDDFYQDWAMSQFGARAGLRIAPVFARLDCRLPRPSNWVDGPGGIVPDPRSWGDVSEDYAFVEELTRLRPLVQGAGNLERFDYWLANFKYMKALGKLNCTWAELNASLEAMGRAERCGPEGIGGTQGLAAAHSTGSRVILRAGVSIADGDHIGGDGDRCQLAAARVPDALGCLGEGHHRGHRRAAVGQSPAPA